MSELVLNQTESNNGEKTLPVTDVKKKLEPKPLKEYMKQFKAGGKGHEKLQTEDAQDWASLF